MSSPTFEALIMVYYISFCHIFYFILFFSFSFLVSRMKDDHQMIKMKLRMRRKNFVYRNQVSCIALYLCDVVDNNDNDKPIKIIVLVFLVLIRFLKR